MKIKTKIEAEGLLIPSCNGSETIAGSDFFDLVDIDFGNFTRKKRRFTTGSTPPMLLKISEITKGKATFRDIFECIARGCVGNVALTEGQILSFLKKYAGCGLRWTSHGTFFLLFDGEEFFTIIARTFLEKGKKRAIIHPLEDTNLWGAGDKCWIVTPQ